MQFDVSQKGWWLMSARDSWWDCRSDDSTYLSATSDETLASTFEFICPESLLGRMETQ